MHPEADEHALARGQAVALLLALRAHELDRTRQVLAENARAGRGRLVELLYVLVRGVAAMLHEVGWDIAGTLAVRLESRPDLVPVDAEVEQARALVLRAVQLEADGDAAGAERIVGQVVDAEPSVVLVWGLVTAAELIEQLLVVCRDRGVPVPTWLEPAG
ncbi:hypothetical protein [Crossiella sp. CA198]|uniref:hypothetical protein n=1 Tax=Crossiella sp. CA198 TaxID=3455607 RepID=UPI003F8D8AD5